MTRLIVGRHPDFDELSAWADRPEVEAARSRVGRHVARCSACAETVNEIRALGEAARAERLPSATLGLWARIEQAMDTDVGAVQHGARATEHVVRAAVVRDEAAPEPGARPRKTVVAKRAVLGLALMMAASAVLIGLDSREPLAAATPRRLQADREFAHAGAVITFHYRPIPELAAQQTLTVWMYEPGKHLMQFDPVLVRAGSLRRVSALDFSGSVVMPDSSPVVMFVAGDSAGVVVDRTELRAHLAPLILAADSLGRPRLDALTAALGAGRATPDRERALRWTALMRELYPTAPETWIFGSIFRSRSAIGEIVKLFESRERQYYGWHDRLEHRRGLSEVTEVMMANLGWELMDTARAEFWTTRLVQDHPSSEYAASLWLRPYRDVPTDSVVQVLQAFEPVYARAKLSFDALQRATWLAQRSGDSAMIGRWTSRADPRGMSWLLGTGLTQLTGDAAAREDATRRLRDALAETDAEMNAGPTLSGQSRNFAWYTRQRLRTRLAAVRILGGDASGGKAALDSIVAEAQARPTCWLPETLRWRAEALRRLGSMRDAEADLAYVATTENWRDQLVGDSACALLGGAYSKAAWDRALVKARAAHQSCWADSRDSRRRTQG